MIEKLDERKLVINIDDRETISVNRSGYAETYLKLAINAVLQPGPNSCDLGLFEFHSLSGSGSQKVLERICEGDLDGLALMHVDFKFLVCMADREDLIGNAPLEVVFDEYGTTMKLAQIFKN